jgi:DNA-binding NarL/FixJ family response regulator
MPIRVSLIEDDQGTRETLEAILQRSTQIDFAGAYSRGDTGVVCVIQDAPDVVLVDINLPGRNGIECARAIKQALPAVQVVMLTTYSDNDLIFESLKAGASGYLLKRCPGQMLIEAIIEVRSGGAPMSVPIARKVVSYFQERKQPEGDMATLTPREMEILALLSKGLTYKGIAEKLAIAAGTVRSHLHTIYEKLHVQSRTEAVLKYLGR